MTALNKQAPREEIEICSKDRMRRIALALLDELEAAEKRIAEMEARNIALPDRVQWSVGGDWSQAQCFGWNMAIDACRAATLQAGNSPATPDTWIPVSERMPEAHEPIYIFHPDYGVDEGVWYDNQEDAFLWDSDCSRCRAIETVSHWMPMPALPAAPQQENL